MYRISYEKRVLKDLDKIPNADGERINEVFKELSLNPTPAGYKKLSGGADLFRVRQGDYRIVYTIDRKEKKVAIILVRHRKEAYRQL